MTKLSRMKKVECLCLVNGEVLIGIEIDELKLKGSGKIKICERRSYERKGDKRRETREEKRN